MTIQLHEMSIKNERVLVQLRSFLDRVKSYVNVNDDMPVRVYVNSDGDFTVFESVSIALSYSSTDHKMIETIRSKYAPIKTDFKSFCDAVNLL